MSRPWPARLPRPVVAVALAVGLVTTAVPGGTATAAAVPRLAPLLTATDLTATDLTATDLTATDQTATGSPTTTGRYVVVLKHRPDPRTRPGAAAARRARALGADVTRTFDAALTGYSATLTQGELRQVREQSDVAFVTPERIYRVQDSNPTPSWGLDRLDQRGRTPDQRFVTTGTGRGVTVFVLDTGIRATHRDFGGRAVPGWTAIADGRGTDDCHGHGTHVAGTIGGSAYGVAKGVRLVAVRVMDCAGVGTTSGLVAAIDWVTRMRTTASVANLSLGGDADPAVDAAVKASIAAGVTYVTAAGNTAVDACGVSPARLPEAITVAATTPTDARDTGYSNYGGCVDVFAPGTGILSAGIGSDTAVRTSSGTSMAAPHVAGAAAIWLAQHPRSSPAAVTAAILGQATPGIVGDPGAGSPNLLLHLPSPQGGVAFTAGTGNVWTVGAAGSGDLRLAAAPRTSPAIAAVPGGYQTVLQTSGGRLWTSGALGSGDLGVDLRAGGSPAITATPDGSYRAVAVDVGGQLTVAGPGGVTPTALAVREGTSPAVAALPGGPLVAAYQTPAGTLGVAVGVDTPERQVIDTGLAMAAATSPSVAASGGAGYRVAFQAPTGLLWTYAAGRGGSSGQRMAPGTSPAIGALAGGGVQVAFVASTGIMWALGNAGLRNLGVTPGGPAVSISGLPDGGYVIGYRTATGKLATTGAPAPGTGTPGAPATTGPAAPVVTDLAVAAGTTPTVAP